jgi:hypothetical protein
MIFACTVLSALLMNPAFAVDTGHDHHHGEQPTKLQLDAGKKWETDAPLRQSMAKIRQSLASSLKAIHANQLTLARYNELAKNVESSVSRIVAQCKLPPAADAQLHIIVAELMSGAELMSDQTNSGTARNGAVKVIEALNRYGQYFNDPGFKKLGH